MGGRPSCPVCPVYIKIVDFEYGINNQQSVITLFKSTNPGDTLKVYIDGKEFMGNLTVSILPNGETRLSFIQLLKVDNVIRVSLTDASTNNTVSDEVTYIWKYIWK